MEKKDRQALIQLKKKEGTEKNCVNEKEMTRIYFQFMNQSAFARNIPEFPSSFPSSKMHHTNKNSGLHYMPTASTPLRTPHPEIPSPLSSPPAPSYEAVDKYDNFSRISQ